MSLVTASIRSQPTRRGVEDGDGPRIAWATGSRFTASSLHADDGPPRVGYTMDQQIHLRGVNLEVHWKLVECRPSELAVWEGRGPARSRARTEYVLHARGRRHAL